MAGSAASQATPGEADECRRSVASDAKLIGSVAVGHQSDSKYSRRSGSYETHSREQRARRSG